MIVGLKLRVSRLAHKNESQEIFDKNQMPFHFDFLLLRKTIGFIVLFWYLMQFARFIGQCRILARPAEQDFRFL